MKGSNATSARATAAPRDTGQSSGRPPPTRTSADELSLTGPSDLPDPSRYAYRKDLADISLAGRVIASHYAEPLARRLTKPVALHIAASENSDAICELKAGEAFAMLDNSVGWAWGYAGENRRVGYVRSDAIGA